jgi:hypothetical protein
MKKAKKIEEKVIDRKGTSLSLTIAATTPSGTLFSWHVMPRETSSTRPLASCGREVAHSAVSLPGVIDGMFWGGF